MTFLTWSNSSFQIIQQMLEIFFQSSEDVQEEESFSEESEWLGLFLCIRPLIAELKQHGHSWCGEWGPCNTVFSSPR